MFLQLFKSRIQMSAMLTADFSIEDVLDASARARGIIWSFTLGAGMRWPAHIYLCSLGAGMRWPAHIYLCSLGAGMRWPFISTVVKSPHEACNKYKAFHIRFQQNVTSVAQWVFRCSWHTTIPFSNHTSARGHNETIIICISCAFWKLNQFFKTNHF